MTRGTEANAFSHDFLNYVDRQDHESEIAWEATWAGPWRVEERDGRFLVIREAGGEPEAIAESFEIARLLAIVFPLLGRPAHFSIEAEQDPGGVAAYAIKRARREGGPETVAWGRTYLDQALEPLAALEYLLRTPSALAMLLESAPIETLRIAGALLAKKTGPVFQSAEPETPEHG